MINDFKAILLKYKNYFKIIIFLICTFFLIQEISSNYLLIEDKIKNSYIIFIIAMAIIMIYLNIISYRFFFILKSLKNFKLNFVKWSKLFFQTVIMNLAVTGLGHFFRATNLKKNNISYKEFVSVNYVIYLLITLIN